MKSRKRYYQSIAIVTLFFFCVFSFYSVPKAHATWYATQKGAIRLAYNAASPAAIAANTSKWLLVGWRVASVAGVMYLLYDSGAITAISNWWNSNIIGDPSFSASRVGGYNHPTSDWHFHVTYDGNVYAGEMRATRTCTATSSGECTKQFLQVIYNMGSTWAAAYQWMMGSPPGVPSSPVDYAVSYLGSLPSPDSLTSGLFGSPGAGALISTGLQPEVVSAGWLDASQGEAVKNAMGLTGINPQTGEQTESAQNDNTVTQGDRQQVSLLQSILDVLTSIKTYAYNLIGIKTDTGNISLKMDNVATGISAQTQAVQSQSGKLDNIATGIDTQTQAINQQLGRMDNLVTGVSQLKEGVTETTATENSLSSRVDELKTLASSKFPFSLVSSISVTAPQGGTYSMGGWKLNQANESTMVNINPMNTPLADLFVWVRQLFVYMLWALTIFGMIKRVTNL